MSSSRFLVHKSPPRKRLRNFVALDILTAQVPLIEIIHTSRNRRIRIWVAYNPERTLGTYTEVHYNGMVTTDTVLPGGDIRSILNRPADRKRKENASVK